MSGEWLAMSGERENSAHDTRILTYSQKYYLDSMDGKF